MKAALLTGPDRIEIRDVPEPRPREGEVLVRVRMAGICGTDFAKYRGDLGGSFPIVAGHEAVGEIAALGAGVDGIGIGERVAIQPNFACGLCETCRQGLGNICPSRVRLGLDVDGVFAEYVVAPVKYVWRLPEGLPDQEAALTEPLSVAIHGFRKRASSQEDRALVYGTGAIGLFFVRLAVLSGTRVTAFNASAPRLDIARKLGAADTFSSAAEIEKANIGFTVIYETSGSSGALEQTIRWSSPGAKIVLTGLPEKDSLIPAALIARKELLILGAMTYRDEFGAAIDLLHKGDIPADLFITKIHPFDKLPEALARFRSPARVKELVRIS